MEIQKYFRSYQVQDVGSETWAEILQYSIRSKLGFSFFVLLSTQMPWNLSLTSILGRRSIQAWAHWKIPLLWKALISSSSVGSKTRKNSELDSASTERCALGRRFIPNLFCWKLGFFTEVEFFSDPRPGLISSSKSKLGIKIKAFGWIELWKRKTLICSWTSPAGFQLKFQIRHLEPGNI